MAKITVVPLEIITYIAFLLPPLARVALLRTCRQLQAYMAPLLYRRITAMGMKGRLLSLTVLSNGTMPYGNLIERLEYVGRGASDMYMTYPLLADALGAMPNLHTLSITVPPTHVGFFSALLKQKGLVRESISPFQLIEGLLTGGTPSSRYALPVLQDLTIQGDANFVALAKNRKIRRLCIKTRLTERRLGTVMENIDPRYLTKLKLTLYASTTMELVLMFFLVGNVCYLLEEVDIDGGIFNALDFSESLYTPSYYPFLRRLTINGDDRRAPIFGSPRRVCYVKQFNHLTRASIVLVKLEYVRFGPVVWTYGVGHGSENFT
ncbi:hypothetical protein CVT26_009862 [Gymnopilus dilepis]|uniref:F-box domain-containing protein n=1 Tax=Gymnopilus dilepis TaxID=231916 RepID=A0A409YC44_9AGAR|nr:hypothetical protein CVT26_009862 [Gymnopilus dilepis]